MAAGNLHGGLVGLHGDQALLGPDGVARLHQHFDHAHLGEVADVGHLDVDDCHMLQRSCKTVQVGSDVSILDALIADGVPVLWDCRRGECGLCPLPVIEAQGGIEHHDHYLTTEEKESDETLCICVSRTRGSRLVLDA